MFASGSRRELLKFFLPICAVVAVFVIVSALFLSALFMEHGGAILQEREEERLQTAMKLFSRVQMGSIPAYINAIEDGPIRDYLYGREWSKERTLRALELLDRTLLGNDFIDSFYLYHDSVGYLSTRSGWEGFEILSDPELPNFLTHIRNYGLARYVMRRVAFDGDSAPRNLFTVVLGYLPPAGRGMRFAFVANLSERRIRETLFGDGTSSATMYILDGDHRFLSHPDASLFGTPVSGDDRFLPILKRAEARGSSVVRDGSGRRWIATWMDQSEMRWRFVTLTPEAEVFAPILRVRDRVVLSMLLVLAAAVAVAFALSLAMSAGERRSKLMLAFLRGEMEDDRERAGAAGRSFKPPLRCPCAMALVIAEGKPAGLYRAEVLLREGLALRVGKAEVVRDSDHTFVVLFSASSDDSGAALRDTLVQIRDRHGISLGAFRIPETQSEEDYIGAYRRLRNARRHEYLRAKGSIIDVPPLGGDSRGDQRGKGPADLEFSALEKAFRLDDSGEALRRLQHLDAILREAADPELFRYTVSFLGRRIPELLGDEAEALLPGGSEGFRSALSTADRLDGAMELLRSAADRLKERGGLHAERRRLDLIRRVKDLVDDRLGDRALGTATIASEVGLSSSYLRDLFKRSEGSALLEYIGSRRLETAKDLLSNSQLSVREICDRAGFISYSYFFTYFKKATGLTPSEFRDKGSSRD